MHTASEFNFVVSGESPVGADFHLMICGVSLVRIYGELMSNIVFVCNLAELHPVPFEGAANHITLNRELSHFETF
jgi:hypothetical protein